MKLKIKLCFITLIILSAFSLHISVFSENENSINSKSIEVLDSIGIIQEQPDRTDIVLSRGEFLSLCLKLVNMNESSGGGLLPYKDVTRENTWYNQINIAYDLGIISREQTHFYPDNNIRFEQAVKILVELLGHGERAIISGGYPTGYLLVAREVGILKNIELQKGDITYKATYDLLYNTLLADVAKDNFSSKLIIPRIDKGNNLLRSFHDIYVIEGILDGTAYYGLDGIKGLGENKISIDKKVFYKGSFKEELYFGKKVEAYVKSSGNKQLDKILLLYKTEEENDILIKAANIISYEKNEIKYKDKDGDVDSVIISKQADYIYNGRTYDFSSSDTSFIPQAGYIKLIKSGKYEQYDIVIIKSYTNVVVGAKNADEEYIIGKYYPYERVYFSDAKMVTIREQSGKQISFEDIRENDVLSVYMSLDKNIIDIILLNDKIAGEITGISNLDSNNESFIELEDKQFEFTSNTSSNVIDKVKLGEFAVITLDMEGFIANISIQSKSNTAYGYIFHGNIINSGLNSEIQFKLLKTDGSIELYKCSDNIQIDNTNYKDAKTAFEEGLSWSGIGIRRGVVRYGLDAEGKINYLEYPTRGSGNIESNFRVTASIQKATKYTVYKKFYYNIGYKIFVSNDTLVFRVPELGDNEIPDYDFNPTCVSINKFADQTNFEGDFIEGYSTNSDSLVSNLVLIRNDSGGSGGVDINLDTRVSIVGRISRKLDGNGSPVEALSIFNPSLKEGKEIYSEELGYLNDNNISVGDLVRVEYDSKNMITEMEVVYKKASDTLNYIDNSTGNNKVVHANENKFDAQYRVILGKVLNRKGEIIEIIPYNYDITNVQASAIEPYFVSKSKILKYDEKKNKVVEIKHTDIKDYYHFGEYSKAIIYTRYGDLMGVFIEGEN